MLVQRFVLGLFNRGHLFYGDLELLVVLLVGFGALGCNYVVP